jgi:DNA-binding MarR family transcriptional regulator
MNAFLQQFDETIHAPRRLAICAFLAAVDEAEFSTLRDALAISDSSLSKQLSILVGANYLAVRKSPSRGRVRTWVRLSPEGRAAFVLYRDQLRSLLEIQGRSGGCPQRGHPPPRYGYKTHRRKE